MNSLVFEDVLKEYSKEWDMSTKYTMNVDDEHEIEFIRRKIMIDEYFEQEWNADKRRKAYKKLLLHYHPDKRSKNQTIEKEMIDDHILRYLKTNVKKFKEPYRPSSLTEGKVFGKWKRVSLYSKRKQSTQDILSLDEIRHQQYAKEAEFERKQQIEWVVGILNRKGRGKIRTQFNFQST